jgi:hypothetical protein
MTDPAAPQEPEGLAAGAIWLIGAGVVVVTTALVVVAWLLVVPPPSRVRPAAAPSPLLRALFDPADRGGAAELRAADALPLTRYEWVDRTARVVRIPIDRAIDAVAADPRLIGETSKASASAVGTGTGAPPKATVGASAVGTGTDALPKATVGASAAGTGALPRAVVGTGAPSGGGQ